MEWAEGLTWKGRGRPHLLAIMCCPSHRGCRCNPRVAEPPRKRNCAHSGALIPSWVLVPAVLGAGVRPRLQRKSGPGLVKAGHRVAQPGAPRPPAGCKFPASSEPTWHASCAPGKRLRALLAQWMTWGRPKPFYRGPVGGGMWPSTWHRGFAQG